MKKISIGILLITLALTAASVPSWQKKSGWKNISIYAKANGGTEKDMKAVTPRTVGAYWAGRVTKFYWSKPQSRVTKVKVRVTWSSKRGKPCGKIVELPIDGYKDFNLVGNNSPTLWVDSISPLGDNLLRVTSRQ